MTQCADSVTTVRPNMPPFSVSRVCPKCGDDGRIFYHDVRSYLSEYACAAVAHQGTSFPGEHLCVTCQTCHFRWYMATKECSDEAGEDDGDQPDSSYEPYLRPGCSRLFIDVKGSGMGPEFVLRNHPRLQRRLFAALRMIDWEPVAYGSYSSEGCVTFSLLRFDGSGAQ